MPIYEYKCFKCEKKIELIQKEPENPLCCCEDGDPVVMNRLFSKVEFRFKGSGWYETDYKKKD